MLVRSSGFGLPAFCRQWNILASPRSHVPEKSGRTSQSRYQIQIMTECFRPNFSVCCPPTASLAFLEEKKKNQGSDFSLCNQSYEKRRGKKWFLSGGMSECLPVAETSLLCEWRATQHTYSISGSLQVLTCKGGCGLWV